MKRNCKWVAIELQRDTMIQCLQAVPLYGKGFCKKLPNGFASERYLMHCLGLWIQCELHPLPEAKMNFERCQKGSADINPILNSL